MCLVFSTTAWIVCATSDCVPSIVIFQNLQSSPGDPSPNTAPENLPRTPEVITVTFNKVNGSMGLSIVAAKGEGQEHRGIYIKSVVPGGAAALVCTRSLVWGLSLKHQDCM